MKQNLIFTNKPGEAVDAIVAELNPAGVYVLVDVNTQTFVLPRLQAESQAARTAKVIMTKAGDINKNLDSLQRIWKELEALGATRRSLLICVGGGVVTDMGAFAAATFKRGMTFINLPTTLLGAVDASVGGKTGINLNNLKNQIGTFSDAEAVIVSALYFNTLTSQEFLSGYAEMIKHALLKSKKAFNELIGRDTTYIDPEKMLNLLEDSVLTKVTFVEQDPREEGIRKALNLGHTIGHAFETLALERKSPIAHGYAVAYGMIAELLLSHRLLGFPSDVINSLASFVKENYPGFYFDCDDYPKLLSYMASDKKNVTPDQINFTLLREIGKPEIDCVAAPEAIREALDITRDLLGI